jgi:hypothetical protein
MYTLHCAINRAAVQAEVAKAKLAEAQDIQAQVEATAASDRTWLARKEAELQEALRRRQAATEAYEAAEASARQLQVHLAHEQSERKAVVEEIEQRYQLVTMAKVRSPFLISAACALFCLSVPPSFLDFGCLGCPFCSPACV